MGLRGAQRTLDELISALDFSYDLAKNLYSIYVFCRDTLAKAMYRHSTDEILQVKGLMDKLYDGFVKAADQDTVGHP